MGTGRFSLFLVGVLFCLLLPAPATAGWWFGAAGPWERSGLDLQQGYDLNTVISIEGTVTGLDLEGTQGPALAKVQTASETLSLVLGPKDYWQENGMPLQIGDTLSARGSKAQGKDGQIYLMVQNLKNTKTTGNNLTELRNDTGRPRWSGSNRSLHQQRSMQQVPIRHSRGGNRP
jgi:hypothetical protein